MRPKVEGKSKVLLITSFFSSPYHCNRAPYNELLFKELCQHYQIEIIRPIAFTDIYKSTKKLNKKEYLHGEWQGIKIHYPTFYYIPKYARRCLGYFYWLAVVRLVEQLEYIPDVFYTTWAYPDAYATMLLARKYKRDFILRVHGSDINVLLEVNSLTKRIITVLNAAAIILSPSEKLKEKMVNIGVDRRKIHVIYSGVDKKLFKKLDKSYCIEHLKLNKNAKRILFIGNLKVEKGVYDLLFAISLMAVQKKTEIELLYIGDGPERQKLLNSIYRQGLTKFVRLMGPVAHSDLPCWINSSDVVVLPSYSEGVPNVILEAMACGTNVVTTNVGGIPEVVTCSEKLIDPGDIKSLANNLEKALYDITYQTKRKIPILSYGDIALRVRDEIISPLLREVKKVL